MLSPSKGLGLRNVSGEAVSVSTPVRALLSPLKGGGRTPGRGRTPVKVRWRAREGSAREREEGRRALCVVLTTGADAHQAR